MKLKNPLKPRCGTCRFLGNGFKLNNPFSGRPPNKILVCQRYPQVVAKNHPDEWCGDYQRSLANTIKPMTAFDPNKGGAA